MFKRDFSRNSFKKTEFKTQFLDNVSSENLLNTANRLVHYGWKKEAIPITQLEKSLIARFFDAIFN